MAAAVVALPARASVKRGRRVVQYDGVPTMKLSIGLVRERDPQTGKSQLPWLIIFINAARACQFLCFAEWACHGPSWVRHRYWSTPPDKRHRGIRSVHSAKYDYLNFIPLYVQGTIGKRVDMQGVRGARPRLVFLYCRPLPLITKARALFFIQRGVRYITFQKALENNSNGPRRNV